MYVRFNNVFIPYAVYSQLLSTTSAVFDMFVCISCMCLRVRVDLIQPLKLRPYGAIQICLLLLLLLEIMNVVRSFRSVLDCVILQAEYTSVTVLYRSTP